jgi:iron(III) transport system permease protein
VTASTPHVKRVPKLWHVLSAIIGLGFVAPTGYLVVRLGQLGGSFSDVVFSQSTLGPLVRTLVLAVSVTLGCAIVGTGLAWLIHRTDIHGRALWAILLPLPLVIPSFVYATAIRHAFGMGGLIPWLPRPEGFLGAFTTLVALSYPYVYLPVASRLRRIAPSVEEGSRILGASSLKTFISVVVPQARGAIVAGSLLVFLYTLSDFGAVSMMRYDTLTRAIFSNRLFDQATAVSMGLLLAVLALIVGFTELRFRFDLDDGQPLIGEPRIYPLGGLRLPAAMAVGGVAFVSLAAPVLVFITWWITGVSAPGAGYGGFLETVARLWSPAVNTAVAGAVAAVVAAVVVFPVAYARRRVGSAVASSASMAVVASFALPGLVIALAIGFWALQLPVRWVYQSFPLLIVGYVVHFGAQSLRSTQAALDSVGVRYDEAAQTLQASERRRLKTIDFPLVRPGVLAGAGLVMLSVMKELPATLMLAPIGFETLATRIWNAAADGFLAEVGVASLLLIAVSAVLTWTLVLRSKVVRS